MFINNLKRTFKDLKIFLFGYKVENPFITLLAWDFEYCFNKAKYGNKEQKDEFINICNSIFKDCYFIIGK